MKPSEILVLPLFERFIRDTYKGRRLKPDGTKIKTQTVRNYKYILTYLTEFEAQTGTPIRIKPQYGDNKRIFLSEKQYWRKFYHDFTNFLYIQKGCHDNYAGTVVKIIRMFFNYLNKELGIKTGEFYKSFYICREEIPVITLLPQQLQFLIKNVEFDKQLPPTLKKSKDIFVFGCTVALRVSDLFHICFKDIEAIATTFYLRVKTIKTGTDVRIKLPGYAMDIINRFKKAAKKRKEIFPPIPRTRFNDHIKQIAALAGWTEELGKFRNKRGVPKEERIGAAKRAYRFCDLISSHTMRRTAITTMLMLGMKEHAVKQVSGHAGDSRSFYRYVNIVQSYMDNEMDAVFDKLAAGREGIPLTK